MHRRLDMPVSDPALARRITVSGIDRPRIELDARPAEVIAS
jgi:hypothetical protein